MLAREGAGLMKLPLSPMTAATAIAASRPNAATTGTIFRRREVAVGAASAAVSPARAGTAAECPADTGVEVGRPVALPSSCAPA